MGPALTAPHRKTPRAADPIGSAALFRATIDDVEHEHMARRYADERREQDARTGC